MKKIVGIYIYIIFISTISCSSNKKYFGSSDVKLDETGVVNFLRYLNGTFHAEDTLFDRAARNMTPLYYAISDDGKVGYGWFCQSTLMNDCSDFFLAYRTVEFCKEYSQKNCALFAIRNEIVWNNLNITVDKIDLAKNLELLTKLNLYNEKSSKFVNEGNYFHYINMQTDTCSSNRKLQKNSNLRGSSLDCLLPGRYELRMSDTHPGRD